MKSLTNRTVFALVYLILSASSFFGQTLITVGTQTGTNLTNPFATGNHDSRYQFTLTSAELTASGLNAHSVLTAIGLNVTSAQALVMNGLTISIKHTSAVNLSAFDNSGFTQVYNNNFATSTTGWKDLAFHTNFVWDGASNLLIQFCFDNTTSTTHSEVTFRAMGSGNNRAIFERVNNANGCSLSNVTTSVNIPIVRFTRLNPPVPVLSNYSADATLSTSFAHRRGASTTPKFTISAPGIYNAVQIELNTLANFSGTPYITTINESTTYNASALYDFWTTQTLPANRTYFVRVRTSINGGLTWGNWSTQLWPYSCYPSTPYEKEGWYFTAQEQF